MNYYLILAILCAGVQVYLLYLVNKDGRTKAIEELKTNLVQAFNELDSTSRKDFIENANLNKGEIIIQINKQTKNSATDIIGEVKSSFGIIQEDLSVKGEQIESLENEVSKKSRQIEVLESDVSEKSNRIVELEEKVKPREISNKERKLLVQELSKIPSSIQIVTKMFDPESLQFGQQLKEILEEAKWSVLLQKMASVDELSGMTVFTNTKNGDFVGKDLLTSSLNKVGIEVQKEVVPANRLGGGYAKSECIIMVIGHK
jgi:hypothetical protein